MRVSVIPKQLVLRWVDDRTRKLIAQYRDATDVGTIHTLKGQINQLGHLEAQLSAHPALTIDEMYHDLRTELATAQLRAILIEGYGRRRDLTEQERIILEDLQAIQSETLAQNENDRDCLKALRTIIRLYNQDGKHPHGESADMKLKIWDSKATGTTSGS